jgi:endonuclease/exonuclease/phosphatase family metal-dependent hydrolase
MTSKSTNLSRRRFLQSLVVAAAAPAFLGADGRPTAKNPGHCVVSANIRVPLPVDDASDNSWTARRKACAEVIGSRKPDIVCLQEALLGPVEDLLADLGGSFREFGFHGPEMDARPGEYQFIAKNPILYAEKRYALISAGGFWLSEKPHLPGTLSWGSARARHVNWARLRDRWTGQEFRVLNTHLDHESQGARERQLAMILEEAASYAPNFPQILAGDFNVDARNPVFGALSKYGWRDTFAEMHGSTGDGFTAHAFEGAARKANVGRIDFIFGRGAVAPLEAEIIRDRVGERYPSDHFFVSARVAFA